MIASAPTSAAAFELAIVSAVLIAEVCTKTCGAARDMLAGDLGDAPALGLAQIGELAGAAAGEDDVDAALDHPIDMAFSAPSSTLSRPLRTA